MRKLFTTVNPLAILAAAAVFSGAVTASENLFQYDGKTYQLKDLLPEQQQSFFDNLVEARERNIGVIDQAVLDIYVDKLAASQNKSVVKTREELLKVEPVSDKDIQVLYDQFKGQIGLPLEQVKEQLVQRVESLRIREKLQAIVVKAKQDNGFRLMLPPLETPTFEMDLSPFPATGAENPKITVVEVADYRCPYCKTATEAVAEMMKKHGKDVKLVYIDLPVMAEGGISEKVMEGGYCARQQNKFWEYNAAAFAMQSRLSLGAPAEIAKKIGLNSATFTSCMASDKPAAYVKQSAEFARSYGVSGTPTFFVDGQRIHTHDPVADLSKLVEDALR